MIPIPSAYDLPVYIWGSVHPDLTCCEWMVFGFQPLGTMDAKDVQGVQFSLS